MTLTRLGSLAIRLAHKNRIFQRLPAHGSKTLLTFKNNKSTISDKKNDEDDELDKPVQFSSSKAATWSAVASRTGVEEEDKPWYQGYVIVVCISVFMIYFCILREENDVDEKLTMDLSDHFHGKAKENLEVSQDIYREFAKKAQSKPVN